MIKFFRKIRKRLIADNKISRYILYAIGEIALVVIGILIAIQLNNLNEKRLTKAEEIEILKGIKEDLYSDTIDINDNINSLSKILVTDSLVLEHLYLRKNIDPVFLSQLLSVAQNDLGLILHRAHFDELKQKGLSLISNEELRDQVSRLYEFDYELLMFLENKVEPFDRYSILHEHIIKYFQYNPEKLYIDPEGYQKLLNDRNLQFQIEQASKQSALLLHRIYLPKRNKILDLIEQINAELNDS